ncbi:MAG: 50S ribosomal protein L2 [Planctomycetota bacterium]|nr:50S ribosomal protein L2 [Planctomycetota bacterium]
MAIKSFKPTSPGRRGGSVADFSDLTKKKPEKSLLRPLKRTGGRNNLGRMTQRRRGGGHKRRYRVIDFKRRKDGIPARVAAIEYDPNRTCRIALLHYADGEKRYILAPLGLTVGTVVSNGSDAEPKPGNCMELKDIPVGLQIHNVEMVPGRGGQLVRAAGGAAQLQARDGKWATVLLPSGTVMKLNTRCRATIGQIGNVENNLIKIGKAGRNRWLGRRPKVRGSAMNPVAHPMGGGEGRRAGGRHPVSFSGVLAKGGKTRSPRKNSTKRILKGRKKGAHQK